MAELERLLKKNEKECFFIEDLDALSLDEFRTWAAEIVERWPDVNAELVADERYEGGYSNISWAWTTLETDEQFAVRRRIHDLTETRNIERRRQQYESLKKEFGS